MGSKARPARLKSGIASYHGFDMIVPLHKSEVVRSISASVGWRDRGVLKYANCIKTGPIWRAAKK
jgi:hypothetical protein